MKNRLNHKGNYNRCADHRRRYRRLLCGAGSLRTESRQGTDRRKSKYQTKRLSGSRCYAINAYIVKGRKPQDYVDYATKDAAGIVRQDLLLTAAENFNEVTAKMEKLGLVILKDENGDYVARGNRNIKINGENFKPLLADAVHKAENVDVLNYVNITDLLVKDGQVYGAVGFSIMEETAYIIRDKGSFLLQQAERPDFISRTIRDFPDIRCGIRRLTQVPDMQVGILAGAEMTFL